jgi:hypothetical protein
VNRELLRGQREPRACGSGFTGARRELEKQRLRQFSSQQTRLTIFVRRLVRFLPQVPVFWILSNIGRLKTRTPWQNFIPHGRRNLLA